MNGIKSKSKILKIAVLCVIMVILIMLVIGCSSSGYRTFKDRSEIGNLSFEYPASYSRKDGPRVVKGAAGEFYDLALLTPKIDKILKVPNTENQEPVTVSVQPVAIGIVIHRFAVTNNPEWPPRDAQSWMEWKINETAKKTSIYPHFQILERSTITVASIPAERVRYVVDELFQPGDGSGPLLRVKDLVCFDFNGLIWEISSSSYEEYAEQVKADFEHVLQTFQILE